MVKMSIGTSRSYLKELEGEIAEKRKLEDTLRDQIKAKQEGIERICAQINDLQDQQFNSSQIQEEVGLLRQRRYLRELCEREKRDKDILKEQLREILDQIETLQDRWRTFWRN